MNEGWVCPRCGRVNAPFTPYCNCRSSNVCNHKWVYGGTTMYLRCEICGKIKTERYRYDTGSGLI